MLKQERAAKEYIKKKEYRAVEIGKMSNRVFEKMNEEVVAELLRGVVLEELRRRGFVRRLGRKWKEWARAKRKEREESVRMREEAFIDMKGLGLGGTVSGSSGSLAERDRELEGSDEFEVDVALQQVS
jgi:hypothetical protein